MQGLVTFAHQVAAVIGAWLPVFCLAGGASFLILGCLLLYQSQRAGSPYHGRNGLIGGVLLCGFLLLGCVGTLNMTSAMVGPARVAMGAGMTSYDAADGTSFLGMGPVETLLAILEAFRHFFMAVGAAFIVHAIFGLKGVYTATVRHRYGPLLSEATAGACIMNMRHIAGAVAASLGHAA